MMVRLEPEVPTTTDQERSAPNTRAAYFSLSPNAPVWSSKEPETLQALKLLPNLYGGPEVLKEARRELPRSNLMQRFGTAQDVADAVTYLAAPSGSFITGEVLTVDGGNQIWGDQWTIPRPDYFGGPAG